MKKILLPLIVLIILGVGVFYFTQKVQTMPTTTTSPTPSVTIPTYIGDQGMKAATALGWTSFTRPKSEDNNLNISYSVPPNYQTGCGENKAQTLSACVIALPNATVPEALVLLYKTESDPEYLTTGFSAPGVEKQIGYAGGSLFTNVTMGASKAFTELPGVVFGQTLVDAFAYQDLGTAPYSVVIVDIGKGLSAADWTTFISTVGFVTPPVVTPAVTP